MKRSKRWQSCVVTYVSKKLVPQNKGLVTIAEASADGNIILSVFSNINSGSQFVQLTLEEAESLCTALNEMVVQVESKIFKS